jgi:tripartite-type tricarboxylate transporter receptor subunit TctC
MIMKRICALLLSLACAFTGASSVLAQADFPTRPVKIIIGFPPGTGIDIITRIYARKLEETLGQSFVVENRAGASGNLAAAAVARMTPDGYTLLSNGITQTISMSLFKNLNFDIAKDFEAVGFIGSTPSILTVNTATNITSVQELIAAGKARRNELTYSTAGTGTAPHMSGDLFNLMTGAKLRHVPYRGNVQALADLIGGHVSVMFPPAPLVVSQKSEGRLKLLATTSKRRTNLFPDLPSLSETPGLETFDTALWYGFWATKRTPKEIVQKINMAVATIADMPDVKRLLAANATDPMVTTPDEFAAFVRREVEKWAKVVDFSGIKVE